MNKTLLLAAALTAIVILGSHALALSPMGIPISTPAQGEFRVSASYEFSDTDPQCSFRDGATTLANDFGIELDDLENLQQNMVVADISYGLTNDWEAYVRLGGGNFWNEDWDFGGDNGFIGGGGTKLTWLKQEAIDWGALFNINWSTSESTDRDKGDVELTIDAYEIQIAAGPVWKASDIVSVYGGPFAHYFSGDVEADADGNDFSVAKLKLDWEFGGYAGVQLDLKPDPGQIGNSYYIFGEFQLTANAWGIGTGIGWRF